MWSKGNSEILIIALYIDDLIFIKNNEKMKKDNGGKLTSRVWLDSCILLVMYILHNKKSFETFARYNEALNQKFQECWSEVD